MAVERAQPLRVLILEDRPSDARLVISELRQAGFEPVWERVDTEKDYLIKLESAWDIILADYSLPQFDALQALRLLRERQCWVPLIIVSGTIGEETAVAAMKEGAADYILKDRLGRLGQAVTHAIAQRRLSELQRKGEEVLRERTQVILLTADVGMALNRTGTLHDMLQSCAQAMVTNLDAAFARIWTLNAEGTILELVASAGQYTHIDGGHARVPVGAFKIGLIAQERAAHLTNDVLNDPRVSDRAWAKREAMVAFAGYPLIVEDRLVGVMAMFARRQLSQATLDAMATVANQIAAGIERKRTEEALRFTQFTIDHVATPVFWADANGLFFNVNQAACGLTGYSRDELLSLYVSDVNRTIPREEWNTVWGELRQRGALALEGVLRRKDGTEICISISSTLLRVEGRECSCTFLQDITERKQAERVQRESEIRFHAIYNQLQLQIERMPLAYVLFNSDFRLIDWNPAAEQIFGYSKDEVLGMGPPFQKIVPEAFRGGGESLLFRIRAGDMSAHSVNDNLTKDGRTITCEWINTPLVSSDGSFNGLMCLAQDITERKRLEEQFRQAQKMEAVGLLAGGIAHEFNNLLQAIKGYTQFAIASLPANEQPHQDLQVVLTSAERATVLTRQLLSFGRRQVLQRTQVDLNQVVSEFVKMLRPLIGENIEVQTRLAPDIQTTFADVGQVQQVLMNLCINARDAMPDGGRLVLRTQSISLSGGFGGNGGVKPGRYVLLTVADTGSGMSPEVKTHLFEPFFTTKGAGKGTGLGLATVYGIIEQHEGHIHVYSELGNGTSFKIYLPVSTHHGVRDSTSTNNGVTGGSETILVAEDDDLVRGFIVRVLQSAGYKAIAAIDGADALRLFAEHAAEIDLALLDVVMPHMGGRALFQEIRTIDPNVRVIFCSGHDPELNQAEAISEQGFPLLQKPVDASLLLQTVRAVLETARQSEGRA